jgi:glutathione peroxidase
MYDITMKNVNGKEIPLARYKGNVVLIVNVASQCAYIQQRKDLEPPYRKYRDRRFIILGLPANNVAPRTGHRRRNRILL